MRGKRIRLHGLDLSTKHAVSDTREPEMKKATQMHDLNENNNDLKCVLFYNHLNWPWIRQ